MDSIVYGILTGGIVGGFFIFAWKSGPQKIAFNCVPYKMEPYSREDCWCTQHTRPPEAWVYLGCWCMLSGLFLAQSPIPEFLFQPMKRLSLGDNLVVLSKQAVLSAFILGLLSLNEQIQNRALPGVRNSWTRFFGIRSFSANREV